MTHPVSNISYETAVALMEVLSNVRRCLLAMTPVAGFLEMFAGVAYNKEKNESLACTPPLPSHQVGKLLFIPILNSLYICSLDLGELSNK